MVKLAGFDNYYREGARVFNKKGKELTPDPQGRYKLKVYKGYYKYYYPPIFEIVKERRISREEYNKLDTIPGFSNYRITKDKKVITKTRRILENDNNTYHLKNDNNEYRNLKIK